LNNGHRPADAADGVVAHDEQVRLAALPVEGDLAADEAFHPRHFRHTPQVALDTGRKNGDRVKHVAGTLLGHPQIRGYGVDVPGDVGVPPLIQTPEDENQHHRECDTAGGDGEAQTFGEEVATGDR